MTPEFFSTLYAYNDWANREVVRAAARITPEQYAQQVSAGWGSVRGLLTHLLNADRIWMARWRELPAEGLSVADDAYATPFELLEPWEAVMAERQAYLAGLTVDDLHTTIHYQSLRGPACAELRWQALFQGANHGTDHRGHLSILLTEYGQPPAPLDFIVWVRQQQKESGVVA